MASFIENGWKWQNAFICYDLVIAQSHHTSAPQIVRKADKYLFLQNRCQVILMSWAYFSIEDVKFNLKKIVCCHIGIKVGVNVGLRIASV